MFNYRDSSSKNAPGGSSSRPTYHTGETISNSDSKRTYKISISKAPDTTEHSLTDAQYKEFSKDLNDQLESTHHRLGKDNDLHHKLHNLDEPQEGCPTGSTCILYSSCDPREIVCLTEDQVIGLRESAQYWDTTNKAMPFDIDVEKV
ncbi:uncharacterized protein I206_103167 [Kwoniella pini CBS 10737]|uniref:Uncharacterized protein n=1 Tax=Kwoniella pini CBS 10737 TaxID=1296096 RepID=A0A1B9IAU1_9TREE|nr:uncharacterized protein I206_01828 [Kwoniella pini CBS 10737]OCF52537.1 hypothetical protein I206_01828 [Kwoniella pini CBS 10737]